MDGRNELFAYLGSAIVTIVALFGAQGLYASYLDVHVVHAAYADAPVHPELASKRAQEQQKLSSGKLPIERAMQQLAQRGRTSSNAIAPTPSTDLSAMSGWVHRRDFKPYEPRVVAAPPAPEAPADGTAPVEGTAPAEGAPAGEAADAAQPAMPEAPAPAAAPAH